MKTLMTDSNTLGLLAADHISAMLAYWDRDLVCRFANSAYRGWFDRTREEMVDKITLKQLLGPIYLELEPYILGALSGQVQTFERELVLPTGGVRYVLAHYYPDIVDGKVMGFVAHATDITTIKLLELELLRSNNMISEQNKRLLNFANVVTHNLRSYAGNLSSILDFFINAESEQEKSEMLNYLKQISSGFTATINNLTDVVKVHNQNNVKIKPINLFEYVQNTIDLLRIQIQSSNAVIHNNIAPGIILPTNPAYMESIILNFLTNAIKYKHPDRDPIINLRSAIQDDKLVISIQDNGLGIDLDKYKEDIFGIYKTFHKNEDATGIGLFITRSQIESLGGRVEVESEVNAGTTFRIVFLASLALRDQ